MSEPRISAPHHRSRSLGLRPHEALLVLALSWIMCGCAHPHDNLPTYRWTDDVTALRILQERARSVKTVSAAALLTLTRPDGQSVRLDGALVMSLPEKSVRLRAWKFNQAVFDLTLIPQGLWIETPKDKQQSQTVLPTSVSAAQLARALSLFGGTVFDGAGVRVTDTGAPKFQVRKQLEDNQTMTADVDRSTLTVRQYRLTDHSGTLRFTLTPRDYRNFNGTIWPTQLIARSDHGQIGVEMRDVELNGAIPLAAFIPPRRAEKAP